MRAAKGVMCSRAELASARRPPYHKSLRRHERLEKAHAALRLVPRAVASNTSLTLLLKFEEAVHGSGRVVTATCAAVGTHPVI